jgi:acyl-CoA reductase-like NAD-dependent aldehyde dehydrogenase
MNSPIDWRAEAARLDFRNQAFIDGRFTPAISGKTFDTISPIDGRVLAHVAACDAADIDRAVAAARAAFEKGSWSEVAPRQRKRTLIKLADLIAKHANELALLETLDMGKPVRDARGDVAAVAECVRWYGEAIDKLYDEIAPTPRDALALITREPVGIVAAVVPWNYPLLMAAWKFAPALATGNSVVLKPAEQSPLSILPSKPVFQPVCLMSCPASAKPPDKHLADIWMSMLSRSPDRRRSENSFCAMPANPT